MPHPKIYNLWVGRLLCLHDASLRSVGFHAGAAVCMHTGNCMFRVYTYYYKRKKILKISDRKG